ncbi:MAG: NAD(P)H-hydrate epimerase [Candidatus Omnitrophota bacterium]|nr:NAD(P)H-hydrate epimerase [Candidatus Omnitrophota bacterium]
MKLFPACTVAQIQELDRLAIERYRIPSLILMENAGRAVAVETMKSLRARRRVSVVCGAGNNAGDGFVAARHLLNAGVQTEIWLIGPPDRLKPDAAVNFRILKACGFPVLPFSGNPRAFENKIRRADVIVDAIFGVGLNREITGPFRSAIEAINAARKYVVSADIPSGLDGTTGQVYGVCVKARKTVTFSSPKKGFTLGQGPAFTGRVIVADIGIPGKIKKEAWHGR